MSSPIAIPARAASPALSERSDSSTSSSSSGKYVPVHKRGGASSSTSPASSWHSSSPMSNASSQPRKPRAQKKPKANNANSGALSPNDASKHTHIPSHNTIPTQYPNLPFVYPVAALLALSYAPVTLSSEQLDGIREINTFIPAATPKPADKAAARPRRVGRQRKNTLTQTQVAAKAADVLARRTRQGHGTWGWNPYTTPEAVASHQHDLETSWRHAPVVAINAAA